MKYKILDNSTGGIPYNREVQSLTDFANNRFGFKKPPSLVFNDDIENSNKILGKTGYYDPQTYEIHIFVTGRHPKDILRSLAHEFVHHMQNEKGQFDDGGYSGPGYAQKNPHLRDMEREAYELGNLCFRDWEDSLKQNHPTIYNERRNNNMSLKEWKNKELSGLLFEKFGLKSNLNEMYGQEAGPHEQGMESYVSGLPEENPELGDCIARKLEQGMNGCEAEAQCQEETGEMPPSEYADPVAPVGTMHYAVEEGKSAEALKESRQQRKTIKLFGKIRSKRYKGAKK